MGVYEFEALSLQRRLVWDLLKDTDNYYLNHHIFLVDFTAVDGLRRRFVENGLRKPSYAACVLYAISNVVPRHSRFNSYLRVFPLARIARYKGLDIAYTLEKQGVLSLSVLRDVQDKSFDEFLSMYFAQVDAGLEDLEYNRTRKLFALVPHFLRYTLFRIFCKPFPSVMRKIAGTVAFTCVGKYGVDITTPLSPKTLTVSLGCVRQRPIARDGRAQLASSAYITLTYDHRVADGRDCAVLGNDLRDFIEKETEKIQCSKA